jgi:hypothetical protein
MVMHIPFKHCVPTGALANMEGGEYSALSGVSYEVEQRSAHTWGLGP